MRPVLPCLLFCAACGGNGTSTSGNTSGGTSGGTTGSVNTDAQTQHNLDALNSYRSQNGAPALVLSTALNQFAARRQQRSGGRRSGARSLQGGERRRLHLE